VTVSELRPAPPGRFRPSPSQWRKEPALPRPRAPGWAASESDGPQLSRLPAPTVTVTVTVAGVRPACDGGRRRLNLNSVSQFRFRSAERTVGRDPSQ
jgi:hypothetical protein